MKKNTVGWFDVPVKKLSRAIDFYSSVLNEKIEITKYESHEFAMIPCENDGVTGCLVETKETNPSENGLLLYFSVEGRIDDAIEKAVEMGGKLLLKKEQIGPWGYRAVILDSEGNKIALHSN